MYVRHTLRGRSRHQTNRPSLLRHGTLSASPAMRVVLVVMAAFLFTLALTNPSVQSALQITR